MFSMPLPRFRQPSDDRAAPAPAGPRPRGVRLGLLLGVELLLDRSWFLIAGLTLVMYGPVLWRLYPELGWLNLLLALGFAVGLALSVLVHELAHALAGRAAGWPVTRIVLTLMGGHTAFGSVRTTPLPTALVSLAGPLSNVVLAALGTGVLFVTADSLAGPGWALVQLLILANWILGLFNLLPGLPLDGGRVVEAIVWALTRSEAKGTTVAAWCGRGIAILTVAWLLWAQVWRQPVVLVITLLVAGFIFMGAGQALRQARVLGVLDAVRAGGVARPAMEFSPTTPLALVDATVMAATGDDYRGWTPDVVVRDRGAVGLLDPELAEQVAPAHRGVAAVGDLAEWHPADATVDPGTPGGELARVLESGRRAWVCVVDGAGHVTGVVHHEDLARLALRA